MAQLASIRNAVRGRWLAVELAAGAILVAFLLGGRSSQGKDPEKPSTAWEYTTITMNYGPNDLNPWGKVGWELVTVVSDKSDNQMYYIFKRPAR